jgi:hypothetical protein
MPPNVRLSKDNLTDRGDLVINYIEDNFTVFSMKSLYNYNLYTDVYNNVSSFKTGDIFIYPEYISATRDYATNIDHFIDENKVLFRIKINKNIKKWIFLNKYSVIPTENEILINHNSTFIVKNVSTTLISSHSRGDFEVQLIDLELLDDAPSSNEIKKKIYKISGTSDFTDNPLRSALFNVSAQYVFNNFLIKEYADPKKFTEDGIVCSGFTMLLTDQYLNININGENKYLYRPNHGLAHTLRVCLWVYLYGLFLLKYNHTIYTYVITPKYLLQACIAALFLVAGRESECGFSDEVNTCNLTPTDMVYYNNSYTRYKQQSVDRFEAYARSIPDTIYSDIDIEDFKHCIKFYYEIDTGRQTFQLDSKPINQLTSKLFHMSHSNNLLRCRPDARIFVPLPPTHPDYDRQFIILGNYAIQFCRELGDRRLTSSISSQENGQAHPDIDTFGYDVQKFYENSTNVNTCISTILDITIPYINEMIADIEENYRNFTFTNFKINTYLSSEAVPIGISTVGTSFNRPKMSGGNYQEDDYVTDVDYALMSTNNNIIGTRFFVPKKYVEEYKKLYPEFTIVPNLSEFGNNTFKSFYDYYDFVNKRINYYVEKGFDIYDEIKDVIIDVKLEETFELLNPVSNEEYIKMLKQIEQNNKKYKNKYLSGPERIELTTKFSPLIPVTGGSKDNYYIKYLKYKQKYLQLKNQNK